MAATVIKNHGSDPATIHYLAVANSSVDLNPIPRGFYVNTTGILEILDSSNTWVQYQGYAGGTIPFRAIRIGANTTANCVAWV
jgi:hypothetical protein